MTINFPQGVPDGCTKWLNQHIGSGVDNANGVGFDECEWFYQRMYIPYDEQINDEQPTQGSYVPSITVKDPVKATWFALRWGGQ